MQVHYTEKNPKKKLPVFFTNLEKQRVDQAVDNELDGGSEDDVLWDSDNEIEEGDADLFEDLVSSPVNVVKDNKKAKGSQLKTLAISRPVQGSDEDDTDAEDLDLPESDGEGDVRLRFTSFSEEDMQNPTFSVGLVFPTVQKDREAITEYSVRNRVEIKLPRNDKTRVRAHCADGCSWNIYASEDSRVKAFVVKTYFGEPSCQREWVVKKCTSKWLAAKYMETFRADDKMSLTNFCKDGAKGLELDPF